MNGIEEQKATTGTCAHVNGGDLDSSPGARSTQEVEKDLEQDGPLNGGTTVDNVGTTTPEGSTGNSPAPSHAGDPEQDGCPDVTSPPKVVEGLEQNGSPDGHSTETNVDDQGQDSAANAASTSNNVKPDTELDNSTDGESTSDLELSEEDNPVGTDPSSEGGWDSEAEVPNAHPPVSEQDVAPGVPPAPEDPHQPPKHQGAIPPAIGPPAPYDTTHLAKEGFSNRIFMRVDAKIIEREGFLGPVNANGHRLVHRKMLDYNHKGQNLPQIRLGDEGAGRWLVWVPDMLISRATLEFLGYTREKADQLWTTWLNPPVLPWATPEPDTRRPEEFCGMAQKEILRIPRERAVAPRAQWRNLMAERGFTPDFQDGVFHHAPPESDPSGSEPWASWVIWLLKARWHDLQLIKDASVERQRAIRRTQGLLLPSQANWKPAFGGFMCLSQGPGLGE